MMELSPSRVGLFRRGNPRCLPALVARVRESWRWLSLRLARVAPQRWFAVLLVILLLAFSVAILFQPAVGRGGR
jgi:hypothetical protein